MEEAFLAYLLADAGVAAAVGDRISWTWREQGSPLPAVTLTKVDGERQAVLEGYSGFVDAHVQADCWGDYQADAKAAARAIVAAAAAAREGNTGGVVQGVFVTHEHDSFEGEAPDRLFRTMLTLRVAYSEG